LLLAMATLALPPAVATAAGLSIASGRAPGTVAPIVEAFKESTGIDVAVSYGSDRDIVKGLFNQLRRPPMERNEREEEASTQMPDVIVLDQAAYMEALVRKDLLDAVDNSLLDQVRPQLRAADGLWLAVGARVRVLAYNRDLIPAEQMPITLTRLALPDYEDKIAWAPKDADYLAHISGLSSAWSAEETRQWLQAVDLNHPLTYTDDKSLLAAVSAGEVTMAWVDSSSMKEFADVAVWNFPVQGDAGNLAIVSGAGLLKTRAHPKAAERFLAFLISAQTQKKTG